MPNSTDKKLELSCIKRLTDELSKALSKSKLANKRIPTLKETRSVIGSERYDDQFEFEPGLQLTWLFACLASLSKRQILPSNLADSAPGVAIARISDEVFGARTLNADDCPLAVSVGKWILQLAETSNTELFEEATSCAIECLRKWMGIPKKDKPEGACAQAVSDVLFCGWVYQFLVHQSEKQLKKNAGADVHSPFYTKWFTPSWIAQFLVEEAITKPNQTFVDPACGAGHILVPAFKRTVALLIDSGLSKTQAVKTAIEKLIFGLEIDEQLSSLARFGLYLACRDIDGKLSLPEPNVFTIGDLGGSLLLKMNGNDGSNDLVFPEEETALAVSSLPKKFDALAANPPYMSMRNMPTDMSLFLKEHYPLSKYDLYTAFVELSIRMLKPSARASLICQQSVLSISRFKPLREFIELESSIETIVQLGSGSFPTRAGEKVNNAIITFCKKQQTGSKPGSAQLQFARILYPEEKKQAENFGIRSVLEVRDVETVPSTSSKKPTIAPWCPPAITELFDKYPPLQESSSGIVVVNGLFTCNNKMFVRKFDEVPEEERHEYVPYDKGGGKKWFHSTPYLLHWQKRGDVIREYRVSRGQSRSLPGEDYYFKPGITYSYIGTQGFKARLLSPDSIFDIASSSVFTPEPLRMYMLGFMNSSLVRYLMGVLNPTINFQIGDLRRIPYAQPDSMTQFEVSKLAQEAVELARQVEGMEGNLVDINFVAWAKSKERVIQSEIDRLVFALYKIPPKLQKQILDDPWVVRGQKNVFAMPANTRKGDS